MKSLVVAIAITLIAASSALAGPKYQPRVDRAKLSQSHAMVVDTDSYDVYVGGKLVGRDPDPNIRAHLRDDFYTRMGH